MNRTDPSTGKSWQPTRNSRVCSCHFLDGFPTACNPDPSLHLGKLFVIIVLDDLSTACSIDNYYHL